jgi:hypothetical protein
MGGQLSGIPSATVNPVILALIHRISPHLTACDNSLQNTTPYE